MIDGQILLGHSIRWGMVGGGLGSQIGYSHRSAALRDGSFELVAGAVAGGFAVGIIENIGGAYLVGTELKLTLALAIIIAVLLFKPSGLFGRVVVSRV